MTVVAGSRARRNGSTSPNAAVLRSALAVKASSTYLPSITSPISRSVRGSVAGCMSLLWRGVAAVRVLLWLVSETGGRRSAEWGLLL